MLLKCSQLAPVLLAGMLFMAGPRVASAVAPATPAIHATAVSPNAATPVYYYYRGRRYPYRYHGVYFNHRYYRYGRWHYY